MVRPFCEMTRWRHRVSLAGLPIKLVLGATHFLEPLKYSGVGEKQLYYSQSRDGIWL